MDSAVRRRTVIATLGAGVGVLATPAVLQAQEIPQMNMRWAHFAPAAWGSCQADQLFADEVQRRTNGRVRIQIFWSGSLGNQTEILDLVASGAVEFGSTAPSFFPRQFPLNSVINSLPLTMSNGIQAMRAQQELIETNEAIRNELRRNRVWPVLLHGLESYRLQCRTPVTTLEDLRGKRVRTFGEWPPALFRQLGATPVNIPLTEIYEGLQKGTLDCGYNPYENAGFLRLAEVAPHWSDINLGAIAAYSTFVNFENHERRWPRALIAIMREAQQVAQRFEEGNFARLEQEAIAAARAAGVQMHSFRDQARLAETVRPDMLTQWEQANVARLGDDARRLVADIRRLLAKHS